MRRPAALLVVGIALLLPACSAPAGASQDEIQAWLGRQTHDSAADGDLGEASGPVSPADAAPRPGEGITLRYPDPVRLERVRLSCLGGGTLDFALSVATSVGGTEQTVPDVPCDETAHEHEIPAADVTAIRVDVSGADRDGAWTAVLLGENA